MYSFHCKILHPQTYVYLSMCIIWCLSGYKWDASFHADLSNTPAMSSCVLMSVEYDCLSHNNYVFHKINKALSIGCKGLKDTAGVFSPTSRVQAVLRNVAISLCNNRRFWGLVPFFFLVHISQATGALKSTRTMDNCVWHVKYFPIELLLWYYKPISFSFL